MKAIFGQLQNLDSVNEAMTLDSGAWTGLWTTLWSELLGLDF